MTRVLVTGAGGYIGQHLVSSLLETGLDVTGMGWSARPASLPALPWLMGDVTSPDDARRAAAGRQVIIHLACLPLETSQKDAAAANRINLQGTINMLEAACQTGVEQFIFSSTGQVYGGQTTLPNRESDLPVPASPYASSKLLAETWCLAYASLKGLGVKILRFFNVYGPAFDRSPRSTVETNFLLRIKQGVPPVIAANPSSGRDFIHVREVVRAVQLSMNAPAWSGAMNIGSGTFTSLEQLAAIAAEILGVQIQPEILNSQAPVIRFQADTQKARRLLNFQSGLQLEQGLRELADTL